MSGFTVVIILWVMYQLIVSVTKKKGTLQKPGKFSDSSKLPDARSIKDVMEGISNGTWKDQLKQAFENGLSQQEPLESTKPKDLKVTNNYYVVTEGPKTIKETSQYVGTIGADKYKITNETPREEILKNPSELSGVSLSLTEKELVQGVIWAEILGKPRAMRPFRGPQN